MPVYFALLVLINQPHTAGTLSGVGTQQPRVEMESVTSQSQSTTWPPVHLLLQNERKLI